MAIRIFELFRGAESTVALAARYMADHGLTPADVTAAYDDWIAGVVPAESAPLKPAVSRRHRAGDTETWPAACPDCGGDVEMYQLCHISSPTWRTQLACMSDACAWHGRSRLPIDALVAAGTGNIGQYVTEG